MNPANDMLLLGLRRAMATVAAEQTNDSLASDLQRTALALLQRGIASLEQTAAESATSSSAVAFAARSQTIQRTGKAYAHLHTALSIRVASIDESFSMGAQDLARLRTFLTKITPSVYRTLEAREALEVVDIAYQWASKILLGPRNDNLLRAVDIVRTASREALESSGDTSKPTVGRDIRELEALRRSAHADYVAARNVVMGMLTVEGRAPDLNQVMMSLDSLLRENDDPEDEYDIDADVGQTIIG